MLVRSSINRTRRLVDRTLEIFRRFFSTGYQKLPKNPSPCNPCLSCLVPKSRMEICDELDKLYGEMINDGHGLGAKEEAADERQADAKTEGMAGGQPLRVPLDRETKSEYAKGRRRSTANEEDCEKSFVVAEKLKEIEQWDAGDVDHVLDVEEALHYYSRLNCPAYVGIVDRFFMEIYAELFNCGGGTANPGLNRVPSKPKVRRRR